MGIGTANDSSTPPYKEENHRVKLVLQDREVLHTTNLRCLEGYHPYSLRHMYSLHRLCGDIMGSAQYHCYKTTNFVRPAYYTGSGGWEKSFWITDPSSRKLHGKVMSSGHTTQ